MKSFLFFCATFKRAVITMKKERLPCFWHFATINLSQDSFPSSALYSVFNMKNCTAQLVIAVALLRGCQNIGLYSAPFPRVPSYLDSQGTQVLQRGKTSKIILIFHRTMMLKLPVFYYFLLNHCGICWFYFFFLQVNTFMPHYLRNNSSRGIISIGNKSDDVTVTDRQVNDVLENLKFS